jgi:hypothetical protein
MKKEPSIPSSKLLDFPPCLRRISPEVLDMTIIRQAFGPNQTIQNVKIQRSNQILMTNVQEKPRCLEAVSGKGHVKFWSLNLGFWHSLDL